MTGTWLLLGLFALAYLGSILLKGRAIRGFGLPSGSEHLVLGFLLSGQVFGLIDRQLIEQFRPLVVVALGWLAFRVGLSFSSVGTRNIPVSRLLLGNALSALVALLVGGLVLFLGTSLLSLPLDDVGFLALGCGLIASDNTRHSVRWVAERHGARGELTELLGDLARCSSLLPVLAASFLFAVAPYGPPIDLPLLVRVALPSLLGLALGGLLVLLLARKLDKGEIWGLLLGTCLLAVGACMQLGLSSIAALFTLGLTLSLSRHRWDLKTMVAPTEQPVLFPLLLLAGASVNLRLPGPLLLLLALALASKIVVRVVLGALVARRFAQAQPLALRIGVSQLSCGVVSLILATGIAVRTNSVTGEALLLFAAVAMLLGEVVGPAQLRHVLQRAGEIAPEGDLDAPPESELLTERGLP